MKVLIFTTQFHLLSGAERLAIELAIDLNRYGVHADVLSLYDDGAAGAAARAQELRARGVPAVRFLGLPVGPGIGAVFGGIVRLRRLIRTEAYDAVETSQLSPAVIAAWATLRTRTRHIGGVHAVFERGVRESLQSEILRLTAHWAGNTRYYAISKYAADCWASFAALGRERVRVIYNAVADAAFEARSDRPAIEREIEVPPAARIALFVARLDQWKGVDTALEALGPVLAAENLVLVYVGHREEGDPAACAMLDAVRARIAREGWEHRVRFLGRREDVFRLMASSDVLVHPTRTEGFGLVLAEAMAAGLPIVASDVDGIPEVLAETDSVMVPPDDPQALRAATLRVLGWSSPVRRRAIERGRRRAAAFRRERRTRAMVNFMRDAIAPQAR